MTSENMLAQDQPDFPTRLRSFKKLTGMSNAEIARQIDAPVELIRDWQQGSNARGALPCSGSWCWRPRFPTAWTQCSRFWPPTFDGWTRSGKGSMARREPCPSLTAAEFPDGLPYPS